MQVRMVSFNAAYGQIDSCEPEPSVSDGAGGAAASAKSSGSEGTGASQDLSQSDAPANDCGMELLAAGADCILALGARGRGPQSAACAASLGIAWNCLTE